MSLGRDDLDSVRFTERVVLHDPRVTRLEVVDSLTVLERTSIAFGYPTESYVDFGLPYMFVPVFLFGTAMGLAYMWLLRGISSRELAIPLVAVVFWVSLFQFERSWGKMIGDALSLLIYLSIPVGLIDRFFVPKRFAAKGLDAGLGAVVDGPPLTGRG